MNAQPSLFDVPAHRGAGETERAAARKAKKSSMCERQRQAIMREAWFQKRVGVTQPEIARMLGDPGYPLAANKVQPRLAELGGYGGRQVELIQTEVSRDGAHVWVALEYATEEEKAA